MLQTLVPGVVDEGPSYLLAVFLPQQIAVVWKEGERRRVRKRERRVRERERRARERERRVRERERRRVRERERRRVR